MKLTRWEPFREMDDFFRGFGPMFGRTLHMRSADDSTDFTPLADIVEHDKEYLIKVDLPDVPKQDVKVLFESGMLTVKGERRVEKETNNGRMHRIERSFGAFERSFMLPDDIDAKTIRAESKDGVLTVHLPRLSTATKAKPLAISVQ
jgi:HSP20 family protein